MFRSQTEDRPGDGPQSYALDEIEVSMKIKEGKFAAESTSGPKNGKIKIEDRYPTVVFVFEGAGSDRAQAMLSRPELDRLRDILNEINQDDGEPVERDETPTRAESPAVQSRRTSNQ